MSNSERIIRAPGSSCYQCRSFRNAEAALYGAQDRYRGELVSGIVECTAFTNGTVQLEAEGTYQIDTNRLATHKVPTVREIYPPFTCVVKRRFTGKGIIKGRSENQ